MIVSRGCLIHEGRGAPGEETFYEVFRDRRLVFLGVVSSVSPFEAESSLASFMPGNMLAIFDIALEGLDDDVSRNFD